MTYYFDYAAATPLSQKATEAMKPFLNENFYNPSALYLAAQDVKKALEQARSDVALILGSKSSEIIFTAGGTEADNLAIRGVMENFRDANCIVSAIEHEAVLKTAELYNHKIAPVKPRGQVDIDALEKLIDKNTVLISVMYANNEIGTIESLATIAKLINKIKSKRLSTGNKMPLYFHSDASQAPNYLKLQVNSLGVDLMSLNAGKIYGPKETGCLYIKTGTELQALIIGGGQERGYRSGTQNVANIVGFAAALKEAQTMREVESERLHKLQLKAYEFIKDNLPDAVINGGTDFKLPNNLHLTIPGADNERLLMELDEAGFMVASGSACSASSDEPSHVLKAIGLSDEAARSSLRITMGRDTTEKSLILLLENITQVVKKS